MSALLAPLASRPHLAFLGLGLGLAGSSFFTFGNLALSVAGITPAVTSSELRKRNGMSVDTAVELWAWHFHVMKIGAPISVAVSVLGYGVASLTFKSVRGYLLLASASAAAGTIFTAFMMPTNNRLLGFENKIIASRSLADKQPVGSQALTKSEQDDALYLLTKWKALHWVRITLGLVGWSVGLSAAGLALV